MLVVDGDEGDHAQERQQAAGQRVEEERDRGPSTLGAAVEADQEEERDQRELEEDVEEDDVQAGEQAEQAGLEGQQEAVIAGTRSVTDSHEENTAVIVRTDVSRNSQRLIPSSPRREPDAKLRQPCQAELAAPFHEAELEAGPLGVEVEQEEQGQADQSPRDFCGWKCAAGSDCEGEAAAGTRRIWIFCGERDGRRRGAVHG